MRYSVSAVALTLTTAMLASTAAEAGRIDVGGLIGGFIGGAMAGAYRPRVVVIHRGRHVRRPVYVRRAVRSRRRGRAAPVAAVAEAPTPLPFEGIWGISPEECRDPRGANSNTTIEGKSFDQYEMHCRIGSVRQRSGVWTLGMSCNSVGERMRSVAKIAFKDNNSIVLQQTYTGVTKARTAVYQRCPALQEAAASAPKPTPAPAEPEQRGLVTGTGFFVGNDGHMLTNWHVVKSCTEFAARSGQDQTSKIRLVAHDPVNDLALLKTDLKPPAVAALRTSVRLGEGIAAFGYPLTHELAASGNFTLGNVTAMAGLGNNTTLLQISAPIQPGNSGGPVVDQTGNVIGVVVSGLNSLYHLKESGNVPQNVNFAIKASIAANFLESNGVTFVSGAPGENLQAPDLADKAKLISVFLMCQ